MNEHQDTRPELEFRQHVPSDARDGAQLVVLLHGRGSDEKDMLGLAPGLPSDAVLVVPRAPFAAAPWGYGLGWAWYRYISGDRVVEPTLETSLAALDGLMDRIIDALPVRTGSVVIGGFSQGGTTGLAWALTRRERVAGAVNLSGFLVSTPSVAQASATTRGQRVFWGHGTADPNIPFELAERGRTRLEEWGSELARFDHPGGHTITPDEMRSLRVWLKETEGVGDYADS